jgi:hypothetical protein
MENRTVIGIFKPTVDTNRLVEDLVDRGFDKNDILIFGAGGSASTDLGNAAEPDDLCTLFQNRGVPDVEANYFAQGVRFGDVVVSVQTASARGSDEAAALLDRHGALDIEERVKEWRPEPDPKATQASATMSASALDRSLGDEHQSGRTRGSRVFVW